MRRPGNIGSVFFHLNMCMCKQTSAKNVHIDSKNIFGTEYIAGQYSQRSTKSYSKDKLELRPNSCNNAAQMALLITSKDCHLHSVDRSTEGVMMGEKNHLVAHLILLVTSKDHLHGVDHSTDGVMMGEKIILCVKYYDGS